MAIIYSVSRTLLKRVHQRTFFLVGPKEMGFDGKTGKAPRRGSVGAFPKEREIVDLRERRLNKAERRWQLLFFALAVLLSLTVLVSEVQELVSLSDNPANDYALSHGHAKSFSVPLPLTILSFLAFGAGAIFELNKAQRRKALRSVLAFLLICAVLASEAPELLTLADNPSNDYTVSHHSPHAQQVSVHAECLRAASRGVRPMPEQRAVEFQSFLLPSSSSALSRLSVLRT